MTEGIGVVGLYVHDQDEALDFYVGKLGFQVHTDARNGNYRWLTVKHPNQPSFELGLFLPQEPVLDAATAHTMREMVAKGAMPPLVLVVGDCRAAYDKLRAKASNSYRSRSPASAESTPISVIRQATPGR
jgi:catechol 2,3-dioxygenase-like lactoylglutathione lyase family enzyme